ncbi:Uncharacterized protein BM_BM14332 [Brugia malayi]|uniref:Bm14332, isoform b n=1 Tax=Brugia malayi TaxID=6279 RepID=A0A1P6BN94_BRUMA|nr:Uncharacterized protein BM_BM14332 [Brugia malayi]CDQ08549.1 Bm14332, isoform b [Brugia malayi]VIP00065.1 Uncharacterized protein BM_BM14332 [Brugia malayi]
MQAYVICIVYYPYNYYIPKMDQFRIDGQRGFLRADDVCFFFGTFN